MRIVNDILSSSLRAIGALAKGEQIDPTDGQEALQMLNDMIDTWSLDGLLIYSQNEIIHEITAGQYIYPIGPGGQIGASFIGAITGDILTVSQLISGSLSNGQILSGQGIGPNISLTALGTGTGGLNGLGSYNVNANLTIPSQLFTSTAPRPIRINSAFTRINNSIAGTLDFPLQPISCEDYQKIGIKTLAGPWPRFVYYEPSEPVGILHYWQNPSYGEVHLFCDTVFNHFNTLQDVITFPQGYAMALRWCLAELLMPEYGKNDPETISMVSKFANLSKGYIKGVNRKPQRIQRVDPSLVASGQQDAGWILSGGFNG